MALRTVVFPVAGQGTRMLPATKSLPKEMLPVVDKPIVQYAMEEAAAAGCERFVLVTGRGKALMEDHFDRAFELFESLRQKAKHDALEKLESDLPPAGEVVFTRQQQPLGLGHAVWCARHLVGDEPFGVVLVDDLILGDEPCLLQMAEAQAELGGAVLATMEVPQEQVSRYGVIDPGKRLGRNIEIRAMVEKPSASAAPSRYAVIGRYILPPSIMALLGEGRRGAGGEIQLTDAMARLIGEIPFYGHLFEGVRYDCGDKVGYLHAVVAAALRRPDVGPALAPLLRAELAASEAAAVGGARRAAKTPADAFS